MKKIKNREDIPRMYLEETLSITEIAKLVGLTRGAICSILTHRNIPRRSPKECYKLCFPKGRFGKDAANWKGGKRKLGQYIGIYSPEHPYATKDGYVMEHRLVLEKKIGRYLLPEEVGHHIDGDKQNNAPENLKVLTKGKHVTSHFADAKEVARLKKILKDHNIAYLTAL